MQGRKPTTLTVIQGGVVDAPPAPKGLPKDQIDDWNVITATLAQRGLLDEGVLLNVPAYCSALENVRECAKIIETEGRFIKNKDGIPRAHPALSILQKQQELANRFAAEFGLTPSSKSRKGMGGEAPRGDPDGIDDFV